MTRRAARRLLSSLAVVWAVVTIAFFVHHALPADPARALAGPQARPADVERIRAQLGLDRPLLVQYGLFLHRLAHLGPARPVPKDRAHASCASLGRLHVDLGTSYQRRKPVLGLIADRFGRTALLALCAVAVQAGLGIVAGVAAALRRGRLLDRATILATLVGISVPTFVTGLVLQYWLAYRLRWLPLDGYGTTVAEHAAGVVLPALTLGAFGASFYARFVRDEMIGVLASDFVRTARAKGAGRLRLLGRHALRLALAPLVAVLGMDLGALLGGAIVTEKIFRWRGLGELSVDAVVERDGPVILGVVLVSAVCVVVANLVADAVHAALDPRLRT
jgi:peptide/nickel transport system permease protein